MEKQLRQIILDATSADDVHLLETVQSLWSGYGSIDRYQLSGAVVETVVVKHVRLPENSQHPRGWNTNKSHQRKLHSYQVETEWYMLWAHHCGQNCRVPKCLALEQQSNEYLIVLEDLDSSGYPLRLSHASLSDMTACLEWLANFHATFMGKIPEGLWQTGTYWHLETRPDELANIVDDIRLKQLAPKIDQVLNNAPFQTFVHGDAKLANFCFSNVEDTDRKVAAVDFQYVGGGCGMKDVAYFIGSCLAEQDCEAMEQVLLDSYFSALRQALKRRQPEIDGDAVERSWRPLYPVAWTDFYRFLKGWSPEHWKIHGYSERLAAEVLERIETNDT